MRGRGLWRCLGSGSRGLARRGRAVVAIDHISAYVADNSALRKRARAANSCRCLQQAGRISRVLRLGSSKVVGQEGDAFDEYLRNVLRCKSRSGSHARSPSIIRYGIGQRGRSQSSSPGIATTKGAIQNFTGRGSLSFWRRRGHPGQRRSDSAEFLQQCRSRPSRTSANRFQTR